MGHWLQVRMESVIMKKTAFDKIVVGFVILVVLIFSLLMIYSITIAQKSVLSERKATMKNEISLLVDSSITEYQNGTIDNKTLYSDLQHTATTLDMEIWLTDDKSNIVFKSQASESEKSGSSSLKRDSPVAISKGICQCHFSLFCSAGA